MPILKFLQMTPGVDMKSCNACQNRYLVSKRMPKNVEIKIWSGNACQMMNFDSISQVNPYSNSQSINVAFSPGVVYIRDLDRLANWLFWSKKFDYSIKKVDLKTQKFIFLKAVHIKIISTEFPSGGLKWNIRHHL